MDDPRDREQRKAAQRFCLQAGPEKKFWLEVDSPQGNDGRRCQHATGPAHEGRAPALRHMPACAKAVRGDDPKYAPQPHHREVHVVEAGERENENRKQVGRRGDGRDCAPVDVRREGRTRKNGRTDDERTVPRARDVITLDEKGHEGPAENGELRNAVHNHGMRNASYRVRGARCSRRSCPSAHSLYPRSAGAPPTGHSRTPRGPW